MNANAQNYNPWLHRFILVTAAATFLLLGSGGMVTSHEAGMSVPDWPNTYGYNMFLFPVSKWVGGIFYEHTHRLLASGIGLLTTVLAAWLWLGDSRKWMRWLGVLAFVLVALQGVLGGLRVTLDMDKLGIVHGALAQLFFVLTCALALFTSRWWQNVAQASRLPDQNTLPSAAGTAALHWLVLFTTLLIFLQLVLGATMRHQHAGLAIPDFPAAYGKIWPDTGAAAVALYNEHRMSVVAENPITAFQIILQMAHRLVALAIFVLVAVCAWRAHRCSSRLSVSESGLKVELQLARRLSLFWLVLIVGQIALGAATIWSNKAADVATAHVLVGALALVTGALGCIIAFGPAVAALYGRRASVRQSQTAAPIGVHPSMVGNK
ncbi:MAG: COX15/CtaA family protein [Verrucomicrobiia bacterium]